MESLKALMSVSFRNDWWILLLPAACIGIDVITGVFNSWIEHDLKSYLLRKGLGKKCGEILAIVLGELLVCGLAVPKEILAGVSAYITFMEIVSIFENFDKLGVPIPKIVKKALASANDFILSGNSKELDEDTQQQIKELIKKKGGNKDE